MIFMELELSKNFKQKKKKTDYRWDLQQQPNSFMNFKCHVYLFQHRFSNPLFIPIKKRKRNRTSTGLSQTFLGAASIAASILLIQDL